MLLLAGLLAALALLSYDPRDPNIFSWTAGGEAASPNNWIGGFGASLGAALYALFGFAAWGVTGLVFVLGWRRFWGRPLPNPASKAAGIGILLFSLPMLISLALGRRRMFGEETETGGIVGRALADAFRGRIGTTGAVLVAGTLVLLAVPLATQVSLGDVFLRLRVRFAGLLSRLTVGWARRRDRRTKERLRRTVVTKHLEKARHGEISLDEIPFAVEEAPPIVRRVAGARQVLDQEDDGRAGEGAGRRPRSPKKKPEAQQSLPLTVAGYTYPPVSLLEKREQSTAIDRKALAETGRQIAVQVRRVRRRGRGGRVPPRPRRHDLRVPAGRRHQGQPGHGAVRGPGARPLGRVDPGRAAARAARASASRSPTRAAARSSRSATSSSPSASRARARS